VKWRCSGVLLSIIILAGCSQRKSVQHQDKTASPIFKQLTVEQIRKGQGDGTENTGHPTKVVQNVVSIKNKKELLACVKAQEALFADIEVPFAALPSAYEHDREQGLVSITYQCPGVMDELVTLYRNSMERYGWCLQVHFPGSQPVLLFKKPHRFCLVSLSYGSKKRRKNNVTLVILTGNVM